MTGPAPMTGLRATVAAAAVALCLLIPAGSDGAEHHQRHAEHTKGDGV